MMVKITILVTIFTFECFFSNGQKINKDVKVLESHEINQNDTSSYYVNRIDSAEFVNLILQNPEIVVQFWQPWCGAEVDIMPQVKTLKEKLIKKGIPLILISDCRAESDYLINNEKIIGRLVYYFNQNGIDFKTYIVNKNEELLVYKRILAQLLKVKLKTNYFCFHIKDGRIVYQNWSYYFYKKYLKQY